MNPTPSLADQIGHDAPAFNHVSFSVIIPCHEEAETILPLYQQLTTVLTHTGQPYELLFVDDGSRDGTRGTIEELRTRNPLVRLITFDARRGKTAAYAAGRGAARGDVLILIDGDLEYDPVDIPRLLATLAEGWDVVLGRRVRRCDAWLTRQLPSRIANGLMRRLTGVRVRDFGTGLQVYRRVVFDRLPLCHDWHRFLPVLASLHQAAIAEVPITQTRRRAGRSKYGLRRVFVVALDLLRLPFLARGVSRQQARARRPS